MKAFWWFKDEQIAGMARPGFNHVHWFDLPFDEAVLSGWLGSLPPGIASLDLFKVHLQDYAPRIVKFYEIGETAAREILENFSDRAFILDVAHRLLGRTRAYDNITITQNNIQFALCEKRLGEEISFLKTKKINKVITLTEHHHQKESLQPHFDLHHIGIEDLNAPGYEQVEHLADIIHAASVKGEKMAIHCLAGIGRTSTMLMAAHILMGESADDLVQRLKQRNPTFVFSGAQGEFLKQFKEKTCKKEFQQKS